MTIMQTRCPICRALATWDENPFRPFCSERCKINDIAHWASESYRIDVKEINSETVSQQDGDG